VTSFKQYLNEFKHIDAPIGGGWGRTRDDAIVINAAESSSAIKGIRFDGVALEYALVKELIHFDLIVRREEDDSAGGIEWRLIEQRTIQEGSLVFDHLRFLITGYPYVVVRDAMAAYSSSENDKAIDKIELILELEKHKFSIGGEFWFEISSFFGK
jgi:hypothetical protein